MPLVNPVNKQLERKTHDCNCVGSINDLSNGLNRGIILNNQSTSPDEDSSEKLFKLHREMKRPLLVCTVTHASMTINQLRVKDTHDEDEVEDKKNVFDTTHSSLNHFSHSLLCPKQLQTNNDLTDCDQRCHTQ